MLPLEFAVPVLHLGAMAPVLLVFLGATLGILVEALVPRRHRHGAQIGVAMAAIIAALAIGGWNWYQGRAMTAAAGSLTVDGPAYFFWTLLLVFAALTFLLFAEQKLYDGTSVFTPMGVSVPGSEEERDAIRMRVEHTEVYPIAMLALGGMMTFAAANDLLLLFVALEIMSLPLYVLAGLARRRRLLSQEAALKYFLLGGLSSALFLYGIALLYGATGSFNYAAIGNEIPNFQQGPNLLLFGTGLVAVGLLFKIGAVPFHNWTPDVYQGAPTPVTAFFAACTKIAAIAALLRVLYVALGATRTDWQPLIAIVAAITIVVGSVLAIMQTDIKRMLAYSSVAHAGFLLTAVVGTATYGNGTPLGRMTSVGAVLFYMVAYGFATMGAFAVVTMVRNNAGESNSIESWSGVGRRKPFIGLAFAIFLLSFAGIPLTAGFIGKWAVFAAAWRGGYAWLVVVAVLASLIAAFFYLRVVLVMFFGDDDDEDDLVDEEAARVHAAGPGTWFTIIVGVLATVLFGLVPGPVLDLAMRASEFLR